jgi:prepilin-type N-terminal cleavage/methylation domain-containing protein
MSKTLQKGFTLIELLVVIAIIGILAAVVLVAINPAERIAEANDSKSKSDLGQVATAIESCYTANAGAYVVACQSTAGLNTAGYLKQNLSSITIGGAAVPFAYVAMTAKSNGGGCATGAAYLEYQSTTGLTAKVPCQAAAPTS